jgi:hypothetical protein
MRRASGCYRSRSDEEKELIVPKQSLILSSVAVASQKRERRALFDVEKEHVCATARAALGDELKTLRPRFESD